MTATVGTTGSSTAAAASSALSGGLSATQQKDLFLKLLVAQMKNQDPTSPMDQKDMLGQMAQFTSVEQLTDMAGSLKTMQTNSTFAQSVSMIGKSVDYLDADGAVVTGQTVASVTAAGGNVKLILGNGDSCGPADILKVA